MTLNVETGEHAPFLPNPHETVRPISDWDALTDAVRYMGTVMPREEVRQLVADMDPSRVMLAIKGVVMDDGPLNAVELHIGTTIEWCTREGLIDSPFSALGLMAGIKQEVLDGGVFIGKERPPAEA